MKIIFKREKMDWDDKISTVKSWTYTILVLFIILNKIKFLKINYVFYNFLFFKI